MNYAEVNRRPKMAEQSYVIRLCTSFDVQLNSYKETVQQTIHWITTENTPFQSILIVNLIFKSKTKH